MKTRRLAFATVLTALTAAPAAQPTAVVAPAQEPAPHSWLYSLFTLWAAENRARLAGDDRELSDSFTLTALPPDRELLPWAAPFASAPAGAGAPSTLRSAAVFGPQPQAAGQNGYVNTTDPNNGYTYLGATYTVPSGGDAFTVLVDGYDQAGTITHSSGTLTLADYLDLGDQPGGNGTYNLSGTGTINTPQAVVGLQGAGMFNQAGGAVGLSGLDIGDFPTANGTYTLSGGTLSVTAGTYLGNAGAGVFTQNGGTATLGQLLFAGNYSTAAGTVNLNGGALNVTSIALGSSGEGTSTFNFNGGSLRPTSSNGTTFFPGVLTTANVRNGGAIFYTNFNVTVAQPLVHSTIGGDNATDGGLSKNGTGTLTLTGANTYTGPTYVNTGTLLVNGTSSGTGRVLVANNGSVLGGTGTISAPVTVSFNGAINPGPNAGANGTAANVGTLTTGALTLSSSATAIFDVADMTTYDKLVVNGSSTLGGTLTLNVNAGATFATGAVLDLIHLNSGVLTGAFSNAANGTMLTYSGETFTVSQTATDFELVAQTAVPEPATWRAGALLFGAAGLTLRRRLPKNLPYLTRRSAFWKNLCGFATFARGTNSLLHR